MWRLPPVACCFKLLLYFCVLYTTTCNLEYQTYILPNGLRLVYSSAQSPVAYCGVVVDAGSRDELPGEHGMAHFVEHMLFKGTRTRSPLQIINRLEHVGGDLNAFTSKEETVVHATVPVAYVERALGLLADVTLHSVFPQREIDKEVTVILDEIDSYNDTPSELIYDEFENLLFRDHALGHLILGDEAHLRAFGTHDALCFVRRQYRPERMVLFVVGQVPFRSVQRWAQKHFAEMEVGDEAPLPRTAPAPARPGRHVQAQDTHQAHVAVGGRAYDLYHPDRMVLYLLNNLLGGPGMSSRLNLSLRERRGLVYTVDSTYQPFTDTGEWCVYFGCDPSHVDRCERLVMQELKVLRDNRLSDLVLHRYKQQLMGQMAIASENRENMALSLGKSYLRYGRVDSLEDIGRKIDAVTSDRLLHVANEVLDPAALTVLRFE